MGLERTVAAPRLPSCRYWTTARAAASCPCVARACPIVLDWALAAVELAQRPGLLTQRPREGIGCSA
jgi:hypothetical protein